MKKYVPSGYQIINLDISTQTSGTPFAPETEDEKLLHKLLSLPLEEQKPILLKLKSPDVIFIGFPLSMGVNIQINGGVYGSLWSISLETDGNNLVYNYYEQ